MSVRVRQVDADEFTRQACVFMDATLHRLRTLLRENEDLQRAEDAWAAIQNADAEEQTLCRAVAVLGIDPTASLRRQRAGGFPVSAHGRARLLLRWVTTPAQGVLAPGVREGGGRATGVLSEPVGSLPGATERCPCCWCGRRCAPCRHSRSSSRHEWRKSTQTLGR